MTRHGTTHWDVAAYALGVLEPAEVARCEAHLAECDGCASELEALLPTTKVLADVDLDGLRQAEEAQLVDRLLDTVRVERTRRLRRQRLTAAIGTTAAAVVAGLALLTGATWLGTDQNVPPLAGEPTVTVSPSPVPERTVPEGERFTSIDSSSGVEAEVILEESAWGTRVWLSIGSLSGPLECNLQVLRADGSIEVIGSWRVPEHGYGTPENPDPLLVQAPTAAGLDDITGFQVQAITPEGSVATVVTVPV